MLLHCITRHAWLKLIITLKVYGIDTCNLQESPNMTDLNSTTIQVINYTENVNNSFTK
jgi:hypothetical protein